MKRIRTDRIKLTTKYLKALYQARGQIESAVFPADGKLYRGYTIVNIITGSGINEFHTIPEIDKRIEFTKKRLKEYIRQRWCYKQTGYYEPFGIQSIYVPRWSN